MNDSFKYILNGIQHEIASQSHISIQQKPLPEKTLISQKYILKYFHDWMEMNEMEYFITHHTLLGHQIFQGIHIFHPHVEVSVPSHHFQKLAKMKSEFEKDEFMLIEHPHHMILSSTFFPKHTTQLFIYSLVSHSTTFEILYPKKKTFDLYDIYPLQKSGYEEFSVFIPHKPNSILKNADFNLHFIQFKENNSFLSQNVKREIIEEPDLPTISSFFPDSIFEPLSMIKERFLSK